MEASRIGWPVSGVTTPTFCATATDCTTPANWGNEERLTTASFNIVNAPVAGGHFLGDYMGLAASGPTTVYSVFGIATGPDVTPNLWTALTASRTGNPPMTEPRNRVVLVRRFGGPEGLEVADAPLPTAGPGEVRVRILASGLEYTDVVIRRHFYPQTMRRRPPFVLGYELVGEIDQLGDGVRGFELGDRVADMTVLGSNAAYRTLRASELTRVPAGIDAAEAAAVILSWTTAYQLLHREVQVQRGERVLVQGAAGAVGQALLVLGMLAGVDHRARHSRGADPRARRHADRLPARGLHPRPAGRVRYRLRRRRRGQLSPLVRGAQAPRSALRLRLLRGGATAASPVHHADMAGPRVCMEAVAELVAWRQAPPPLFNPFDAGATSRLVPGGLGAALWIVGEPRHPAARRRAHLLR